MELDRSARKISVSSRDWSILEQIASMENQTEFSEPGLWRNRDDEFLWECMVRQIANRGGTRWHSVLERSGQLPDFRARMSLAELRKQSKDDLESYVREQVSAFKVGRFREDNALSVVANFATFTDTDGRLNLRARLDELDCGSDPVGNEVQRRERQVREYLMHTLVFHQQGKEYHAKRKPPSDYLITVGFARTLLAFDTRLRKVFRNVFGLTISDTNYELVEDWFLTEAYPRLHVTPSQFDRIIFQHEESIGKLA